MTATSRGARTSNASPMRRATAVLCVALLLSACSGLQQNRELPVAAAQTAEEAGKLPVGRVVAVEQKFRFQDSGAQLANPMMQGLIPSMTIVALGSDWYYHHTIQLLSGETIERDEFMEYKVGDCVAIRSWLVVPALADECR